jgi:hypothetical protein
MKPESVFAGKFVRHPVAIFSGGPATRCRDFRRVRATPGGTPPKNRLLERFARRTASVRCGTLARGVFALRIAAAADTSKPNERWFQAFPAPGEYPGPVFDQGKEVKDAIVVIDQACYDAMIAALNADAEKDPDFPGLLIDEEHFSNDPDQSSASFGWVKDLSVRPDGLYALCSLNAEGVRVTDQKIYLYRSPDFDLEKISGKRYRPSRLCALALTNRPGFKLKAASAARAAANPKGTTMDPEQTLAKIREILGLGPDDDVCAAVQTMADEKAANAEAQRTRDCDAFIAANKDGIKDVKAFRTAYTKDPETAKALVGSMRPVTAARRIDASQVRTPVPGSDAAATATAQRRQVQTEIARLNAQGITGTRALQMAERSCGIG